MLGAALLLIEPGEHPLNRLFGAPLPRGQEAECDIAMGATGHDGVVDLHPTGPQLGHELGGGRLEDRSGYCSSISRD